MSNWQQFSIGSDTVLTPNRLQIKYLNQWWPSPLMPICVTWPQYCGLNKIMGDTVAGHFQMDFLERNLMRFDLSSTEIIPWVRVLLTISHPEKGIQELIWQLILCDKSFTCLYQTFHFERKIYSCLSFRENWSCQYWFNILSVLHYLSDLLWTHEMTIRHVAKIFKISICQKIIRTSHSIV